MLFNIQNISKYVSCFNFTHHYFLRMSLLLEEAVTNLNVCKHWPVLLALEK